MRFLPIGRNALHGIARITPTLSNGLQASLVEPKQYELRVVFKRFLEFAFGQVRLLEIKKQSDYIGFGNCKFGEQPYDFAIAFQRIFSISARYEAFASEQQRFVVFRIVRKRIGNMSIGCIPISTQDRQLRSFPMEKSGIRKFPKSFIDNLFSFFDPVLFHGRPNADPFERTVFGFGCLDTVNNFFGDPWLTLEYARMSTQQRPSCRSSFILFEIGQIALCRIAIAKLERILGQHQRVARRFAMIFAHLEQSNSGVLETVFFDCQLNGRVIH